MEKTKQSNNSPSGKIFGARIWRVEKGLQTNDLDYLAVEDPLEIAVIYGALSNREQKTVSVTMRTPGHDESLAVGFLFSEGILKSKDDILKISTEGAGDKLKGNKTIVEFQPGVTFDIDTLDRNFYMTSSCGVCGKASIDAVRMATIPSLKPGKPEFSTSFFHQLPQKLLDQQQVFEHTGGLHAAGLFDLAGNLKLLREDVGRHNAVDKLLGDALLQGLLPLENFSILVSGRISFELVQKALMAGLPAMAAVGAPSSLAVQLASRFGMTLIGFIRNGRYNIYSGKDRVK